MTTVTGIDGYKVLTWTGDFTADGHDDLLIYRVVDGNWELRYWTIDNATGLATAQIGNTKGFGRLDDGRPFWTGRFSHTDRGEVLFYSPGDFNGDGRDEILFYYPGDHNWWLGTHNGQSMVWSSAGTEVIDSVAELNDAVSSGLWLADFRGEHLTSLLMYMDQHRDWWLGRMGSGTIDWEMVTAAPPPPPPPPPPPQVTVPNVVHLLTSQAIDALNAARLQLGNVVNLSTEIRTDHLIVESQSPDAGTRLPQGSKIDMAVTTVQHAQGLKALNLFNCNQDGRAVHIWLFDTSTGRANSGGWRASGTPPPQLPVAPAHACARSSYPS